MDVTFDLSINGNWIVIYDPTLVHADVDHEEFVFEEGLPSYEAGGLVEIDLDQYDSGVRFRCTTGDLTALEVELMAALEAELAGPGMRQSHALHIVSGTVYMEGGHETEEALGSASDTLAHMLHPQNHDDPPSARRVRGWLAHFCLPPGVYALTLHEVLYDLREAPTSDVSNFVLQFVRQGD
jgi:hypothetical protein